MVPPPGRRDQRHISRVLVGVRRNPMCTPLRAALALAVIAGAAMLGGLPAPAHAAGHTTALVARCHTPQLALNPVIGSGATGHIALMFRLHNRSRLTCSLYGYPGAQLLNAKRQPIVTHVHWGGGFISGTPAPHLVILKAAANAYFVMEWVDIPT